MSPLSLRAVMRMLLRLRNRRAAARLGSAVVCEWPPERTPANRREATNLVPAMRPVPVTYPDR
jgi:hypothetical protein